MAGIGFELKKLFNSRGLFASFRAYGYAGVVCTGPMLLGIVLLLGVMYLCDKTGGSRHSRELLVCMITYTLLFSLTVTSFLSMVVCCTKKNTIWYCLLSGALQGSCWWPAGSCMEFSLSFPEQDLWTACCVCGFLES